MQSPLKTSKFRNPTVTQTQANIRLATQIFDKYGDAIREMIRFRVNDESTIDDIFQDLFVSLVYRPIPSGIHQKITGYLYRAVQNDVLDAALRTKSYRIRSRKYAELYMDQVKCHKPEDIIIRAEEVQKLFDIIEKQLMPHEAKAVIQRYYYDRDIGEAAQVMGINKRSFSRYLCMGLKKIRQFARDNKEITSILSRIS